MRSPILVMLWESWRLTRLEAAWRLALGIVAASAVLVLLERVGARASEADVEFGVAVALVLIIVPTFMPWMSTTSLLGGRFGGFGFPFYVHYTRPVRTADLVGVPMAYLATLAAAIYVASALVVRWTFDRPFPVLPIAVSIAVLHLSLAAASWSTRRYVAGHLGTGAVNLAFMVWLSSRGGAMQWLDGGLKAEAFRRWPEQFDFSLAEYGLLAAIGLTSMGVAIAGVARQRRGDDAQAATPLSWAAGAGFSDRLVNLFRFPCPTSSATLAQVWFELKSRGWPVMTMGAVLAMVNPVVFTLTVAIEAFSEIAVMCGMLSVLAVLVLGSNAFGIRWRQGRTHVSSFEATQAYGTARMAGLKVLVRSVSTLAALVAVGLSVWASLRFIAVGAGNTPLRGYEPLRSWQRAIEGALGSLTGGQEIAVAVVVSIAVAVMVALVASVTARSPGRVNVAGLLLLLHGLMLVPMAINFQGVGSQSLWQFQLDALVWVTRWIDLPVILSTTVYVCWRAFADRLLMLRHVWGVAVVSVAFATAWVMLLGAAGVRLAALPATDALWMMSPGLLPLTVTVLAPWSLSRIRHT